MRVHVVCAEVPPDVVGGLGAVAQMALAARGAGPMVQEWSPRAVIEVALEAVQQRKSGWTRADLVAETRSRGMRVLFALGGLAPNWASTKAPIAGSGRPSPKEFRKFVKAVGTRYSGSYQAAVVNGLVP